MTREDHPGAGPDRRIEPRIDWTRAVQADAASRRVALPAWRDRRHGRWAAVGIVVFLLLIVVLRQPLADMLWPQTRVQVLLEQADQALHQDRLPASARADDEIALAGLENSAHIIDHRFLAESLFYVFDFDHFD